MPSKQTIGRAVTDCAIDATIIAAYEIKKNLVLYISADKGNKKGLKHFAKYLCWYNPDMKKIEKYLLDIDLSDETSKDCAKAIYHSLQKLGL